MVCASSHNQRESITYKWLRYHYVCNNSESIEYCRTYGFRDIISWTKSTESYRDTTPDETPWTHPIPPENITCNNYKSFVWICHKHAMKNEPDEYCSPD